METKNDLWNLWAEIRPTGRSSKEYFKDLQIDLDFLRGKKILDIGSGRNIFARELKVQNLDFTSIDAFYALTPNEREEVFEELNEKDFQIVKEQLDRISKDEKDSKLVAGKAETLPFRTESFDVVLAEYSLPAHVESSGQIKDFLIEVARVLKYNGQARIYPLSIRKELEIGFKGKQTIEETLKELKRSEIDIDIINDRLLILTKNETPIGQN
jgi:ubiquinone/menaquinone biosynthesis C-methylase UbiE